MPPPHVMIGAQSNDHSTHLSGLPSRRFYTDPRTFTRVQLLVTEYYGFDVPSNFWDVYNVERVRHYIDALGRDGRCMIHLNQIPAEAAPAHIHAAVAACHAFGRFPIPKDLGVVDFMPPQRESFADFLRARGERLDT